MDTLELMRNRHSVRRYTGAPIPADTRAALDAYAASLNGKSGLHMQILYDEPTCFSGRLADYGHFENASNYIAVVGPAGRAAEEKGGYYGELLALKAQELGLNTCWVALTRGKSKAETAPGEREIIVIALGYGKTQGAPHKSKTPAQVSDLTPASPDWYRRGVEAALLAPTAVNQQKFRITAEGSRVRVKTAGLGPCLRIDLGIVKCHFALGAGEENFTWADA